MPRKTQHDHVLAQRAIEKRRAGEPISRVEEAALRRIQDEQRRKIIDEIVTEFPKRVYCRISGRHTAQLHDQARKYGIPCSGQTIDLQKLIRWIHDTLAAQGSRLIAADGEESVLDRFRQEKWRMAMLDRLERERSLVPINLVQECHSRIAASLKACADALECVYGEGAADILREGIETAKLAVDEMLSGIPVVDSEIMEGDRGEEIDADAGEASEGTTAGKPRRTSRRRRKPAKDRR